MKNKKYLLISIIVLLLLIAVFAITGMAANEPSPVPLRIYGKNLSLQDSVYIYYAVPTEGTEGVDVKLLVWLEPQEDYTYGTQSYVLKPEAGTTLVNDTECYVFKMNKLAAKQMTVDVYARAYASVEGVNCYSETDKYSVLQYCYNMLGKTSSNEPSESMEVLLNRLLAYGAAAQTHFGVNTDRLADADYYQIRVVGASLSDGMDHGLYQVNTKLSVVVPETNDEGKSFRYWRNSQGQTVSRDASYTITVGTENEVYTAIYCSHENGVQEAITPAVAPTCLASGLTEGSHCAACGETFVAQMVLPATGIHTYRNGVCTGCGQSEVPLTAVPSIYDANGDGKTEVYYFSPLLTDRFDDAIHITAGSYDKSLSSSSVSSFTASGLTHWYIGSASQYIVYKVTVPETGLYEMAIHLRMKDAQLRGTLYTINEGSPYEQSFETSYGFGGTEYEKVRDESTLTTYMYGITVNLVKGENLIKIRQSSETNKNQHYRDFYFVKIGDFHTHSYSNEIVTVEPSCKAGEKIVFCTCGLSRTESIPATGEHNYADGSCTGCGSVEPGIVSYDFLYDTPGFAGGTVEFCPADTGTYTFYWGDSNGQLANYTMLYSDEFYEDMVSEITIQSFTAIPKGATKLLAVSADKKTTYSYDLPVDRLFDKEQLYSFGALSDSHQGERYGDTSIPYDHFVNASKILSDKGVSLIGICGDISYENEEFEYILHANAVQEIYEYNSKLPIYTVSGNHESKYTGFSKDWFLKYSRNVVDYDTDLLPIFSEGNDLDFAIELPDGSVMLYLNQIYYDYGNTTSRLLDDYQIEWLEEQLEKYKDRTVFLFFHTFIDEEAGDASTHTGKEYSLPLISGTVEYKRFNELFTKYKNVVYFSGHSHQSFDLQFMEEKEGDKSNLYTNIDNNDGSFATMVHIPSVAATRSGTGLSDAKNRSEGYLVRVYEDCIVFEGYDFVNNQNFAYATYIISR